MSALVPLELELELELELDFALVVAADVVDPVDEPELQAASAVLAAPRPKIASALRRLISVVRSKANPWS